MTEGELRETEAFKWVAVAADRPGSNGRPVLEGVKVEPKRLIATDGFRLRVARIETGIENALLDAKTGDHVLGEFPRIRRLWSQREVKAALELDAPALLADIDELRPLTKRNDTPIVGFLTVGREIDLRRWVIGSGYPDLPELTLGKTPAGVKIKVAINALYVAATLKGVAGSVRMEWCGASQPVKFSRRDRYEIIMPMFVNFEARP